MSRPMPLGCIFSASADGLSPHPAMSVQKIKVDAARAAKIGRLEAGKKGPPKVRRPMQHGCLPGERGRDAGRDSKILINKA